MDWVVKEAPGDDIRSTPGWWFPLAEVEAAEALCVLLSEQHDDSMFLCWYPKTKRLWVGHYGPRVEPEASEIDNCYMHGVCVKDKKVVQKVKNALRTLKPRRSNGSK